MSEKTTIELTKATRNDLRRYKAQDGITYDEAIRRLLDNDGWFDDE